MNWLVFAIITWVAVGLELGLKDALQLGTSGVAPSFVVVLLVCVAVSAPRMTALWAGLILGVLMDLTHKGPAPAGARPLITPGPYTLGCLLAAYTVVTMRAMVFRRNIMTVAFLSALGAAMMHIVVVAVLAVRQWYDAEHVQISPIAELGSRLGSSLYTGALALVVGPAIMFLAPLLGFPQGHSRDRRRFT